MEPAVCKRRSTTSAGNSLARAAQTLDDRVVFHSHRKNFAVVRAS